MKTNTDTCICEILAAVTYALEVKIRQPESLIAKVFLPELRPEAQDRFAKIIRVVSSYSGNHSGWVYACTLDFLKNPQEVYEDILCSYLDYFEVVEHESWPNILNYMRLTDKGREIGTQVYQDRLETFISIANALLATHEFGLIYLKK